MLLYLHRLWERTEVPNQPTDAGRREDMVLARYRPCHAEDTATRGAGLALPLALLYGVLRVCVQAATPAGLRGFRVHPDGLHPRVGYDGWAARGQYNLQPSARPPSAGHTAFNTPRGEDRGRRDGAAGDEQNLPELFEADGQRMRAPLWFTIRQITALPRRVPQRSVTAKERKKGD